MPRHPAWPVLSTLGRWSPASTRRRPSAWCAAPSSSSRSARMGRALSSPSSMARRRASRVVSMGCLLEKGRGEKGWSVRPEPTGEGGNFFARSLGNEERGQGRGNRGEGTGDRRPPRRQGGNLPPTRSRRLLVLLGGVVRAAHPGANGRAVRVEPPEFGRPLLRLPPRGEGLQYADLAPQAAAPHGAPPGGLGAGDLIPRHLVP